MSAQSSWAPQPPGQPISTPMGVTAQPPTPIPMLMDSTAFLTAAAHIDADFAEGIHEEFVFEPRRAAPPSYGVDIIPVIQSAISGRARRRRRDAILLILIVILALIDLSLVIMWALSAATLSGVSTWRRGARRSNHLLWSGLHESRGGRGEFVVTYLVLGAGGFLLYYFFGSILFNTSSQLTADSISGLAAVMAVTALAFGVIGLVILAVLIKDQFTVLEHYRRILMPRDAIPREDALLTRQPQHGRDIRLRSIDELVRRGTGANVIVHRGYKPFVGFGEPYRPWSLVVKLRQADEDTAPTSFTIHELHDRIEKEIRSLQSSPGLSPGDRLRNMTVTDNAIVNIETLFEVRDDQRIGWILPSLDHPPVQRLSDEQMSWITKHPVEWLRCYRSYVVDTWQSDLLISAHAHLGVDEGNLYIEWQTCVLPPIRPEYKQIFEQNHFEQNHWVRTVGYGLWSWLTLPMSLESRVREVFRPYGPNIFDWNLPQRYGAQRSIRELATNNEVISYFQAVDIERYLKLWQERTIHAIADCLQEHGYTADEFNNQAAELGRNFTFIGGNVYNSNLGTIKGSNNRIGTTKK